MKAAVHLEDPQGVINSLQVRIAQLERALEDERKREPVIGSEAIHATLKSVRRYGVILLHVGRQDIGQAREDASRFAYDSAAMEHAWPLASAPIPDEMKVALQSASNYGDDRWY